ncbi:MAG: hypothetical protein R6V28_01870 [Nitriliruptoraceae bacterium]
MPPILVFLLLLGVIFVLLWVASGEERTLPDSELEDAALDEPIRAVKRAHVRLSPDGTEATLTGLTAGSRYEVNAQATCPRGCPTPSPTCRCGFYAMRSDVESRQLSQESSWARRADPLSVRLDVELSGVVLEYELGYRAERQRVLEVGVPDRCVACAAGGVDRQASGLIARPRQIASPFSGAGNPYLGDPSLRDWLELRPACLDHWEEAPGQPALTLGDLADRLGTVVRWEASGAAGPVSR